MAVVFFDDFVGSSLSDVWAVPSGFSRNGTSETEWYEASQVSVANSLLTITAECLDPSDYITNAGITYTWISGNVQAQGAANSALAQLTYGTVTWRARVPNFGGMWPALWLLSTTDTNPEIDVMEMFGLVPPTETFFTYISHYVRPNLQVQQVLDTRIDLSQGFHIWRCTWGPDAISTWCDGALVNTVVTGQAADGGAGSIGSVPTAPMFPIMDLAVRGAGAFNHPVDPSVAPGTQVSFDIDWIRIEQGNPRLLTDGRKHYRLPI